MARGVYIKEKHTKGDAARRTGLTTRRAATMASTLYDESQRQRRTRAHIAINAYKSSAKVSCTSTYSIRTGGGRGKRGLTADIVPLRVSCVESIDPAFSRQTPPPASSRPTTSKRACAPASYDLNHCLPSASSENPHPFANRLWGTRGVRRSTVDHVYMSCCGLPHFSTVIAVVLLRCCAVHAGYCPQTCPAAAG